VGEQGLFNGDVVLDGLRVEIPKFEFATDSPLEGSGFEPSVPRDTTKVSEPAQVASAGFRSNRSTARTRADTAGTPGAFRRTDGSNSCSLQQRVRCELEVS
jgi:hypothetical protein